MPQPSPDNPLPRRRLSREITLALLVKLALLWWLWQFAVKPGRPVAKPDIAALFQPPQAFGPSPQPQENLHVRR